MSISAAVLAGLVALALTPALATTPALPGAEDATPGLLATGSTAAPSYGPDGAPGSAQRLAAYREAAASFPLPLPDGYVFPEDRESPSQFGTVMVLEDWIAATADAALRAQKAGDTAAVDRYVETLKAAWTDTIRPTFGSNVEYIGMAIDERNFAILLQAYPLPDGMTTN